jgi:predicted Zn-dependent peptidase
MWPTIGKDISHIQNANLEDVRQFFFSHYAPDNAILGISGNITLSEVKYFCDKWFAPIENRKIPLRNLTPEPVQNDKRILTIKGNVPFDAIYKVYHSCSRIHKDYPASDLMSDLLSGGKSSRLYLHLVKEKKMFSELDAYVTGDIEPGLFVISGKLMKGIKPETAEEAINDELNKLIDGEIADYELKKVKNKFESGHIFAETSVLNKSMNLAYYELIGGADLLNSELEKYLAVKKEDITICAKKIFRADNCSTLFYLS